MQTSNSAVVETGQHLLGDVLGVDEAELTHAAQVEVLDDLLVEQAAELLVALAADAEELDLLALARSARWARSRARRTIEELKAPDRPRSPVQTSSRWTWSLPVPAQQRRRAGRTRERRWRCWTITALHLVGIGPRRLGRLLGAAQLRRRDHLHGLGDLLRRLGGGDADAHVFK